MRDSETALESGMASHEKLPDKPIGLDEAWQKFLGQAKVRKLSPTSIYKYGLLRKRMLDFAKPRGLHLLRDFNIDNLETFQSEWVLGDVPSLKTLERLKSFFRAASLRKWIDAPSIDATRTKTETKADVAFH